MTYRLRRRNLLRAAGLGGSTAFALAVLGCGGGGGSGSSSAPAGGSAPGAAAGGGQAPAAGGSPVAAAAAAKKGGTLVTGSTVYRSWDPQQETFNNVTNAIGAAYDTLLEYESSDPFDSKVIPGLVEKWEQPDPQSVVLTLRQGVKWHDGKDFTSEDVVFNLNRMRNPPQGVVSPRRSWFANVDDVTAVDARTTRLKMKKPQASFIFFLAAGWVMMLPKHILEPNQEALKRDVLGTGPYMKDQLDFNVQVKLKKNPNYWRQDRPHMDGQQYLVLTSEAVLPAFRSGRLDWILISNENLEQVKNEIPKERIASPPSLQHFTLRLNTKRKPFDDLRVRQAVSYALDRDSISAGIEFGHANISSPMPATGNWDIPEAELRAKFRGYGKDKKKRDEDVAEAKKLLTAAGYPDGFTAQLMLGEGPTFDSGGIIASEQLKSLGINLVPQQEEFTVHLNRTDKGDFDCSAYQIAISLDEPDDAFLVQFRSDSGRNYVKFADADVDRLIDQQTITLDRAKRKELVLDINKRLLDNVAVVFIHWPLQNWTWQPHVKTFDPKASLYTNARHIDTFIDGKR